MTFLLDKRRAAVAALLLTMLGAAALFFAAEAHAGYPCNDEPAPKDTTVNVNNETFVAVETNSATGPHPGNEFVRVCAAPTGGEANQKWVAVTGYDPGGSSTPGYAVQSGGCNGLPGAPGYPPGCNYLLQQTGANVGVPTTSTTTSGAAPGGSLGTGTGTCAYVNGTPACPGGLTVAGVNVATGDASVTPKVNPGGCVTAFGNPCYTTAPAGAGLAVAKGDPVNDTVSTTVVGTPVSRDVGDCYGYNMGSCP